jgi:HEPN domain-containing protein
MDKINIVKDWLDFARKDISSAKYLLNMRPAPREIICYHCEQASEKVLKGYLIQHDVEPPRTHDLRLLCKMCADFDKTFDEISQSCVTLTAYGVQSRYPFEIDILDSDMQKAIVDADYVMSFTLQKLNF